MNRADSGWLSILRKGVARSGSHIEPAWQISGPDQSRSDRSQLNGNSGSSSIVGDPIPPDWYE
jgi:hypothetical protein